MDEKHSILIVDDNPENIKVLSDLIESEGYISRIAKNGKQAVKSVSTEPPDLILMDVQMPGMDGYEATRKIKSNDKFESIPIIFVSAMSVEFNKVLAYEAGAVDYIPKPFQTEEVLSRIKTHLKISNYQRQLEEKNLQLLNQLKSTFEQAAVGIAHFELENTRFKLVNKFFCSMTKYSEPEIYKMSLIDLVHPNFKAELDQGISKLLKNKTDNISPEFQVNSKEGNLVWVRGTISLSKCVETKTDCLVGVFEDITDQKKAEDKLKEALLLNENIVSQSPVGISIYDPDGNCIHANEAMGKAIGATIEQMLAQNFHSINSWKEGGLYELALKTIRDNKKHRYDLEVTSTFGIAGIFDCQLAPLEIIGKPHLLLLVEDVSERRKAEEELTRSEENFRSIFEQSPLAIQIYDKEGKLTEVNQKTLELFGIEDKSSILGYDMWSKDISAKNAENLKNGLPIIVSSELDFEIVKDLKMFPTKRSGIIFVEMYACPIMVNREITGYIVQIIEHTERKLAEKDLIKQKEMFELVINSVPIRIFWKDLNSVYIGCNPSFAKAAGLKDSESVIGKNDFDLIWGKEAQRFINDDKQVISTGKPKIGYDENYTTPDGKPRWWHTSKMPLKDSVGKTIGVIATSEDITESKIAELDLAWESEITDTLATLYKPSINLDVSLKELADSMLESSLKISRSKHGIVSIIDVNNKEIVAHSSTNLINMPDQISNNQILEDEQINSNKVIHFMFNNHQQLLVDSVRKTDEFNDNLDTVKEIKKYIAIPLLFGDLLLGQIVVFNAKNKYTNREQTALKRIAEYCSLAIQIKKSFQALKESEETLRNLIDNMQDCVYVLYNEKFDLINTSFSELFGISPEEASSEDFNFLKLVAPESRSKVIERVKMRKKGKPPEPYYEFVAQNRNRNLINVEASTSEITYRGGRAVLGILRDVSERKRLEQRVTQSQKMDSIGRLAGGIAHDFNNLLTIISGHSDLAKLEIDDRDPLNEHITQIEEASQRASDLTRQLLVFSRSQKLQQKVLNLNKIISNLDKMLKRIIGEHINLLFVPEKELWNVKLDPSQLEQVVINLVVNARDAMPEGGKLTVATQNSVLNDQQKELFINSGKRDFVMLTISDNGVGIPDEVKTKIFEPFFTTKEEGKGTGLGLSTVYGIVKQSNGHILVESKTGEGTTFKILFPRIEDDVDAISIVDKIELPRGTESILIVEDDDALRKVIIKILENLGYIIIEAHNAGEALAICKTLDYQPDLVVTDVIMPGVSGDILVNQLREIWSNLRVLYMSGYIDDLAAHSRIMESGEPFLQKPFRTIDLAWKVRKILDSSSLS